MARGLAYTLDSPDGLWVTGGVGIGGGGGGGAVTGAGTAGGGGTGADGAADADPSSLNSLKAATSPSFSTMMQTNWKNRSCYSTLKLYFT